MKYTISLINAFFPVLLFVLLASTASAHVPFGVYAGTHAVAFVPEPGSPLAGEMVEMNFFLRDLQGNFPTELFIVEIAIQKTLPDDRERSLATLSPKMESPGIYSTRYRFDEGGHYRVEFLFNKIDEPDIIRDAVFDIEVRDPSVRDISYSFVIVWSIFIALASFLGGMMFAHRRITGRKRKGQDI